MTNQTNKTRDSFIFYRSFFQATRKLSKEDKAELFDAICSYALDGELTEMSAIPEAIFSVIQPNLDANRRKWENGCKEKKKTNKKQKRSKVEAKAKQSRSKSEGNVDVNVDVNVNPNNNEELKSKLESQFEEIYRLYNKEKNLKVIPFDKLKSKFQSCLKDVTFEELKQSINDYLEYLSTETWRKKKAFDAWINSPEFYANDWKNESKEGKKPDTNDLSKWSKY